MKKYVFKKWIKRFLMLIFDSLGYLFYLPFKKLRKKIFLPSKILVVRLDQIGDMVQALPFFDAIKKKYPDAEIYALCAKQTEFLLKNKNEIKEVFTIENSWFYKERKINLKEILQIIKKIRKEKIDIAFDLRGDLRNILLLFLSGVKNICGYGCAGGGFLLDCEKRYERDMHEIDKNLFLIDEKADDHIKLEFVTSSEDKAIINEFFKKNCISKKHKKIVIHPFSRAKTKLWGFNKFKGLIDKILKNKNIKIFITGSESERIYAKEFIYNENIIDCIGGEFKIKTAIELIKNSDIFIGCDSSLQYFAAYSGKKTAVIYGFVLNNKRWLPKVNKENFVGFSKPVNCGPCELEECPKEKAHRCMEIITVDEVYNAIKNWIEQ